jgi:hypothetical protein
VSTRSFSRRDLLQLGGRLALSIGAAKLVIALPGCGGGGGGNADDQPPGDAGHGSSDYYSLDDCHSLGTYHYVKHSHVGYYNYTYTYSYYHAFGCPRDEYGYVTPAAYVECYYSPGVVSGYNFFCYNDYSVNVAYTYTP